MDDLPKSNFWCTLSPVFHPIIVSILEFGHYTLPNAHDLTLVTPSLHGWRRSQRLGPSPTLGSFGSSPLWRHKSRVSLRGDPCAHGVASTPHGEVQHIPLPYHKHINPTNTKIILSLNFHGYFGYCGYYSAHHERG